MLKNFGTEEEKGLCPSSMLYHSGVKFLSAMALLNVRTYYDLGAVFSLIFRAYDMAFQANVIFTNAGHITNNGRYYSLEQFVKDYTDANNPAKESDGLLSARAKCVATCKNFCPACAQCLDHIITNRCDCISCSTNSFCRECSNFKFSPNCVRCVKCNYTEQVASDSNNTRTHISTKIRYRGIETSKINSLFLNENPRYKKQTNSEIPQVSKLREIFIDQIYNRILRDGRNADQHGYPKYKVYKWEGENTETILKFFWHVSWIYRELYITLEKELADSQYCKNAENYCSKDPNHIENLLETKDFDTQLFQMKENMEASAGYSETRYKNTETDSLIDKIKNVVKNITEFYQENPLLLAPNFFTAPPRKKNRNLDYQNFFDKWRSENKDVLTPTTLSEENKKSLKIFFEEHGYKATDVGVVRTTNQKLDEIYNCFKNDLNDFFSQIAKSG